MVKFIQANLNHCSAAQDLLLQDVLEENIHVAFISEPLSVPDSPAWIADKTKKAAIWWNCTRCELPCVLVKRSDGFVIVRMGDIILVSCYITPNCAWRAYVEYLERIRDTLEEFSGLRILIGGDFNARSTVWGDRRTNGRGELMLDIMSELDLRVLNVGNAPTCVRAQGSSIVDTTWASPGLLSAISGWRVDTDGECLSDHRRIRFEIDFKPDVRREDRRSLFPKWALGSFEPDYFAAACEVVMWLGRGREMADSVNDEANNLRADLTMASDTAARRSKPIDRRTAYWWTGDIGRLRWECVRARRLFTALRTHDEREEERRAAHAAYREARRALRIAISSAKRAAWQRLIDEVNRSPWGRPYKIVLKRLSGSSASATETMSVEALAAVLRDLFPMPLPVSAELVNLLEDNDDDEDTEFAEEQYVTVKEVHDVVKGGRPGYTAPGLDGIPRRFLAHMPEAMKTRVCGLFNACLSRGAFPDIWRRARLILLPKPGSPNDPPKFRPICLLDDISKAFERVVVSRIRAHLASLPDGGLSNRQFGFRPNLSTMEPLVWLRDSALNAIEEGEIGFALSIDIANAFNSVPHTVIRDALRRKRVPKYLRTIVEEYFRGRFVVFRACDGQVYEWPVNAGVPQGSVLGPLLWLIAFDYILELSLPAECVLTCYADDTLLFARGASAEEVLCTVRVAAARVMYRIESLGLRIATEKMEAIWFSRRRSLRAPTSVVLREETIAIGSSIKYLGVLFDRRVTFKAHLEASANKAGGVMRALGKLMPNMRGPGEHKRRLYMMTTLSVVLYAAPVWAESFGLRAAYRGRLAALQRSLALRVIRGYRTVSFVAATLLARIPPIPLMVDKRRRVYERVREARNNGVYTPTERKEIECASEIIIQRNWEAFARNDSLPGRRVADAILPHLLQWTNRLYGDVSHHMTQVLTGHGVFSAYLCRIGKAESAACWFCEDLEEDADHTLRVCPAWETYRRYLAGALECEPNDLSLSCVIGKILASERAWKAFNSFCVWVISEKIIVEREREREALRRDRGNDALGVGVSPGPVLGSETSD